MKHSETQAEIGPALVKALAALTNPPRTAVNPFFKSKYAPLHATLDLVRAGLAEHGLAVMQSAETHDGLIGVVTRILHASGEWVESDALLLHPAKDDPQGGGSAVTYARRYSLEAMLCICGEVDDDGNAATKPARKPASKPTAAPKGKPKPASKPPSQSDAPECEKCGAIMTLKTVKKEGKNKGREFYGCSTKDPSEERGYCAGFIWADGWETRKAKRAAEAAAAEVDPENDDGGDLPDSDIPF